jgi:hypothetical protein
MSVNVFSSTAHCNKNSIYVFPEKELHGLSPNFHIHVSVSELYIPRIGPQFFLLQKRQNDSGVEDSKTSRNMCEDLLGYSHEQAK